MRVFHDPDERARWESRPRLPLRLAIGVALGCAIVGGGIVRASYDPFERPVLVAGGGCGGPRDPCESCDPFPDVLGDPPGTGRVWIATGIGAAAGFFGTLVAGVRGS